MSPFSRRDLLKSAAAVAAGLSLPGCESLRGNFSSKSESSHPMPAGWTGVTIKPIPFVRIAFIGVGNMGSNHLRSLVKIKDCQVTVVCDIDPALTARANSIITKAGFAPAKVYNGPEDWKRVCAEENVDLVMTATPWDLHVPICLAAMDGGKHVASEVPIALTVEDCWKLVEKSEKTNLHCQMLENCNYGRSELMVFNMVRAGLLGEIIHGECGYNHDLRDVKLYNTPYKEEGKWRWKFSRDPKTGNLYPTHGLGPIMNCMDINRGDYFDYLVSMSTPARGMNAWAKEYLPETDPRRHENYQAGDINTSMIKTKKGYTIYIVHDTNTPRPYTRINMVQGTKGIFQGYPDKIFVEGRTPMKRTEQGYLAHEWDDITPYVAEFEHELYKKYGAAGTGTSHGGMDFIEDLRLMRALQTGHYPDQDIYDGVAMSCIVELSSNSLSNRSKAVDFPDFTRGTWKNRKPIELVDY